MYNIEKSSREKSMAKKVIRTSSKQNSDNIPDKMKSHEDQFAQSVSPEIARRRIGFDTVPTEKLTFDYLDSEKTSRSSQQKMYDGEKEIPISIFECDSRHIVKNHALQSKERLPTKDKLANFSYSSQSIPPFDERINSDDGLAKKGSALKMMFPEFHPVQDKRSFPLSQTNSTIDEQSKHSEVSLSNIMIPEKIPVQKVETSSKGKSIPMKATRISNTQNLDHNLDKIKSQKDAFAQPIFPERINFLKDEFRYLKREQLLSPEYYQFVNKQGHPSISSGSDISIEPVYSIIARKRIEFNSVPTEQLTADYLDVEKTSHSFQPEIYDGEKQVSISTLRNLPRHIVEDDELAENLSAAIKDERVSYSSQASDTLDEQLKSDDGFAKKDSTSRMKFPELHPVQDKREFHPSQTNSTVDEQLKDVEISASKIMIPEKVSVQKIQQKSSLETIPQKQLKKPFILVIGGIDPQNLHIANTGTLILNIDPKKKKWDHYNTLPEPLHNHSAIICKDCLYVIGGCNPNETLAKKICTPKSSCFKLDLNTQKWTTMKRMEFKRHEFALATYKQFIYAIGGQDDKENLLKSVEIFDTEQNKWKILPESLCCGRKAMGATCHDDKIWIVGGVAQDEGDKELQVIPHVDMYDIKKEKWNFYVSCLPSPRCYCSLVVWKDSMYCIGGMVMLKTGNISPTDETLYFNRKSNSWLAGPVLPVPRAGCAAVVHKNYLFVVGGYDPVTDPALLQVIYLTRGAISWKTSITLPSHIVGCSAVNYS